MSTLEAGRLSAAAHGKESRQADDLGFIQGHLRDVQQNHALASSYTSVMIMSLMQY